MSATRLSLWTMVLQTIHRLWSMPLMPKTPEIKGIVLSRRFGKEAGLYAGLKHASGKAVITLDADLQHPPSLIPEMLAHWRKGAEIVHGVKQDRGADSLMQRFTAAVYSAVFSRLSGFDLRGSSDFKLLDRRVVDVLTKSLPEYGRFYRGLSAWVGLPAGFRTL